jgi:hypothetical protein
VWIEQPPASEWDAQQLNRETGITVEQCDYMERLCHTELVAIPAGSTRHCQLSPRNLLLLTLKWLRRYPPWADLANEFHSSRRSVIRSVASVVELLERKLEYLREWPVRIRSKIIDGPLKDTIGAVDTFPICIPQPKPTEERKKYYIYKPGHKTRYGYKVQTFVDLQGRVLDVTDAHPFGSKADIKLFRESSVPTKLDRATRAMAPSPTTLTARIEDRMRKGGEDDDIKVADPEEEEEIEESSNCADEEEDVENKYSDWHFSQPDSKEIPNISEALSNMKALGDKAYLGSDLIYVPYKRFKKKRFTKKKREFNKLLSSRRAIVECVNKRLEDFKVLGTIYRGKRDAEVVSRIVRVIVSLHNYMLESHPMWKRRKHGH